MRKSVVMVTVAAAAAGLGIILYIASLGGFDPSGRTITDLVEGTETRVAENPGPPDHPGFSPAVNSSVNSSG